MASARIATSDWHTGNQPTIRSPRAVTPSFRCSYEIEVGRLVRRVEQGPAWGCEEVEPRGIAADEQLAVLDAADDCLPAPGHRRVSGHDTAQRGAPGVPAQVAERTVHGRIAGADRAHAAAVGVVR